MLADWCEIGTHFVSMATVTVLIEYHRQYPKWVLSFAKGDYVGFHVSL